MPIAGNADDGSDRHGEKFADDAPEHSPENQRNENRHWVQLDMFAHQLRLDEIADDELNGGRNEDGHQLGRQRKIGRKPNYWNRQQNGNERAHVGNKIQEKRQ